MTPFFSVIIPTYNRAIKLKRAIESVLSQSFENFEILVMDDGSKDNTSIEVASFGDKRITYLWDKNFGGPSRPRNRGISIAKGEWICFLDADDWWTSDKLQECYNCISSQVDLIYHDLEIVSDRPHRFRKKIIKSWQVKKPVLMDLLLNGNALSNSSVVVRKHLIDQIGGINESKEMIAAEDYNTWLRIANITDQALYIPRTLGFYLADNQGISQKDMSIPFRTAIAEFLPLLDEQQKILIEARIRYSKGRFNYLIGNFKDAKEDLLYAIKHQKSEFFLKAGFMLIRMRFSKKNRL